MKKQTIKLPHTGAYCETGPILIHQRGEVSLSYDSTLDSGEICWTTITISGVLATRFTPELSVSEEMIDAYDRVVELTNSQWVEQIREVAAERYLTVGDEMKHFMIFFDHFGCFEIAATGNPQISDGARENVPDLFS